jgi:two-component system, OmpR family, sensor histidine kinase ChvG
MRIALGIRAQLLLVLTVFLVLPWLGYEYVRELERFLREAQERTLAGTAQAVATALHDRPRLFSTPPDPIASFAHDRAQETGGESPLPPSASPEIAQIVQGLSRTTARIWVIDRNGVVLARAGSLKRPSADDENPDAKASRRLAGVVQSLTHPLYQRILKQPTDEFHDDAITDGSPRGHDVEGALSGILATDRRATSDGRAVIVSAAHPIWLGDQVRGVVIVEETGNRILAERNRAFERLFNIVLAVLLVGSVALTLFASRLSGRIRRLRDDAEQAIDAQGRARRSLSSSDAGDEIGDLSRSFASVLQRLTDYASYQEKMASRLSHELRTPVAVVRSSLENLKAQPLPQDSRVYIDRAQGGLDRLTTILARMTEATRLEHAVKDSSRERFDAAKVLTGCVDGYRIAYPETSIALALPDGEVPLSGAPELFAQMLDKLVANAVEFATHGPIQIRFARDERVAHLVVSNEGALLPPEISDRLFDSMVSLRPEPARTEPRRPSEPHLGLGLYIVRLVAEFHGGSAHAANRSDASGVDVTVTLPLAS